ncbi:CLUMA_CG007955, isoform A [Clunio marinus]|uniref:CLUMA_CG007955, isoform A n=1 Tax=Clunio marinus TaxID=568069 RepID=A0A1J1I2B8_9DIPT|nr:CLUMA_CG007955, isoform A [Clunio marinus]
MRWLRRSSETPQLLGLSPLKSEDSLSVSTISINSIDQHQTPQRNETPSDDFRNVTLSRKSRIESVDDSQLLLMLI